MLRTNCFDDSEVAREFFGNYDALNYGKEGEVL